MIEIFSEILFFLILINPISKIVIISMFSKNINKKNLRMVAIRSSIVAMLILIAFAFGGNFILNDIFQIDISALMIAGGIVLAYIGFTALNKGVFFQVDNHTSLSELAIVPLASPLIAGPATITATILKSAVFSPLYISIVVIIAIMINMIIMLFTSKISSILNKFNLSGALIRIMGLFIMSMGIELILRGITTFFL